MTFALWSRMVRPLVTRCLPLAIALAMVHFFSFAADAPKTTPAASDTPKATKGDVAKAEQNRKKPLRRCDELKDKAQLECLEKARESIVEARQKRLNTGKQ